MAKDGDIDALRIRLPKALIGYLALLAKEGSVLGASPNDIAKYLLTKEVDRLFQESAHTKKVPTADASDIASESGGEP